MAFDGLTVLLPVTGGLAEAFYRITNKSQLFLVSRRNQEQVRRLQPKADKPLDIHPCDFSKPDQVEHLLSSIPTDQPFRVIYFAGGGPFGSYFDKSFKDHQWAYQVSFLTPSRLLHWAGQQPQLKQMCFIGSAIAESDADPFAASYCAAKQALRGVIQSIWAENPDLAFDLRLFSPGYMDTKMLPPGSWPRENRPERIMDVDQVALKLHQWLDDLEAERHLILNA